LQSHDGESFANLILKTRNFGPDFPLIAFPTAKLGISTHCRFPGLCGKTAPIFEAKTIWKKMRNWVGLAGAPKNYVLYGWRLRIQKNWELR
jgi:hypothetical protein